MDDATLSLLVYGGGVVVLFVWNRFPVEIVAMGTALALWATGLVGLEGALVGFGDSVVIFIAALFVVGEGVSASGLTTFAGRMVIDRAGTALPRLLGNSQTDNVAMLPPGFGGRRSPVASRTLGTRCPWRITPAG